MTGLRNFWNDERGETAAMGLLLLTAVVAIGATVGLTTLRDQIVQELGDLSLSIDNLDQSFTTPYATFVDPGPFPSDTANTAPACIGFVGS